MFKKNFFQPKMTTKKKKKIVFKLFKKKKGRAEIQLQQKSKKCKFKQEDVNSLLSNYQQF